MIDNNDAYRDLIESKKSLYQLLLSHIEKAEKEPLELHGGLSLSILKNVIKSLQDEIEQSSKDFEYLERRLDKTNEIITVLFGLFEYHTKQTAQEKDFLHDLEELKREQKESEAFRNRFDEVIKNRAQQIKQDKETMEKNLPGIG